MPEKDRGAVKETGARKKPSDPKKKALLFIAIVLVLLAVMIPLAFLDYNAILSSWRGKGGEVTVSYYPPGDPEEEIFQNEEYLSHIGEDLTVSVRPDGVGTYKHPFTDPASAKEVCDALEEYGNGAGTLGNYLYALLRGVQGGQESDEFASLFTKEAAAAHAMTFPGQKLYRIGLDYKGTYTYKGSETQRWLFSFDVVRNDGSVLNYTGARDGGEAWILLTEEDGHWRIAAVVGKTYLN